VAPRLEDRPWLGRPATIADIDLMHRIRKKQFDLAGLGVQGQAAPAIWSADPWGLKVCTTHRRAFARDGTRAPPGVIGLGPDGPQPAGYSDAPPSMATSAPVM
jgi:hypothetical protein